MREEPNVRNLYFLACVRKMVNYNKDPVVSQLSFATCFIFQIFLQNRDPPQQRGTKLQREMVLIVGMVTHQVMTVMTQARFS